MDDFVGIDSWVWDRTITWTAGWRRLAGYGSRSGVSGGTDASGSRKSLIIIAMNSAAGFLGHIESGSQDWMTTLIFTSAGLRGTLSGMKLSRRLFSSKLQKAFAVFVIGLAIFLLIDNFSKLF